MSTLEIAANAVYLLAVLLAARNHWSTWPLGVVGCALFALLFYQTKLYANVTLQGFFIITNLVGLWMWFNPKAASDTDEKGQLEVRSLSWKVIGLVIVPAAVVLALGYGYLLGGWTDASAPVADSLMLTLSIAAQFLLMGRRLQTWLFWIAVNLIGIPLFFSQGLYLTSAIYGVFLVNAVYGYWNWGKAVRPGLRQDERGV